MEIIYDDKIKLFEGNKELEARLIEKDEKLYKIKYSMKIFFIFVLIILLTLSNNGSNSNKIKIGFYCESIAYGGVDRVMALLLRLLSEEKNFIFYLITIKKKLEKEYSIPNNINRIFLSDTNLNLFQIIRTEHLDIFIYNFYFKGEIKKLLKLKKTKIILYNHSSYFFWIYHSKINNIKNSAHEIYKKADCVISLVPVENNYLYKKWGINSIFMDNPLTFEYDTIVPSDLSQKNIIMIGRGEDIYKRFDLGIKSMKKIIEEVPESKMYILSPYSKNLEELSQSLKLEENIEFKGYQINIEIYLKNSSLHIFPSLFEAYPLVLSETKLFGIPNILLGLDYLALANEGTVIIYDDSPDTLAKEAIKILQNETYRKRLGIEARESMKKHSNDIIVKRWKKLFYALYNGNHKSFQELQENLYEENVYEQILINQLKLIHMRVPNLKHLTLEKLKSFSF